MRVFTVGHGSRSLEELIATLGSEARLVADVRRFPGSRRHPQFGRAALEESLPAAGIGYEWWGETLGGRRRAKRESRHVAWRVDAFRGYADWMDGEVFREAFAALVRKAREVPLAVMCAETTWWNCHRRLLADALRLDGFEVVHLLGPNRRQDHPLHPQLRRDRDGRPVYHKGLTPSLFDAPSDRTSPEPS